MSYRDNLAVDVSSFDNADVRVTGPNGFSQQATFERVNRQIDGSRRTPTYRINAPGGDWDQAYNGTYSIVVVSNQVSELNNNFLAGTVLGEFSVNASPQVSVTTNQSTAEGNRGAAFIFSRTGSTSNALTVKYSIGGSDYPTLSGSVTLPAGSATTSVPVIPVDDDRIESSESVEITLSSDGSAYNISSTSGSATIDIGDNGTEGGTEVTLIESGSTWKYLDNGSNQGAAWRQTSFNDTNWSSGLASLGFGDDGEATNVSFGADADNKHITIYFRRSFDVSNPTNITSLNMGIRRDDGEVVYLNGNEVFRTKMPEGPINHATLAPVGIWGGEEDRSFEKIVDPALLVSGTNLIAVEVHQNRPVSSDLIFDFKLTGTVSDNPARPTSTPGDATGDGQVNFAAFAALSNSHGQANFNNDGVINNQELVVLINNFHPPANNVSPGDANGDRVVDFHDFVALSNHFCQSQTSLAQGNFNNGQITNFEDLILLINEFDSLLTTGNVTPPARAGDLNDDGVVDFLDLLVVTNNLNATNTSRAQGNLSGNHVTDKQDLLWLVKILTI